MFHLLIKQFRWALTLYWDLCPRQVSYRHSYFNVFSYKMRLWNLQNRFWSHWIQCHWTYEVILWHLTLMNSQDIIFVLFKPIFHGCKTFHTSIMFRFLFCIMQNQMFCFCLQCFVWFGLCTCNTSFDLNSLKC